MKNVVFLGSKEIGYECLSYLIANQKILNYKIVGILSNQRGLDIFNLAEKYEIPILNTLDDLFNIHQPIDILISIQYHEILKQQHIDIAKQYAINLHMAPLPEYRGCNQFSFAILDECTQFGTTIHLISPKIDGGDILFESRFEVPKNIWVEELYKITYDKSLNLFKSTLPQMISGEINPISQELYFKTRKSNFHTRNEINLIKQLDLSWEKNKIERHIRATYMPNFEPPYFLIDGKKFEISLKDNPQ